MTNEKKVQYGIQEQVN